MNNQTSYTAAAAALLSTVPSTANHNLDEPVERA